MLPCFNATRWRAITNSIGRPITSVDALIVSKRSANCNGNSRERERKCHEEASEVSEIRRGECALGVDRDKRKK